MSVKPQDIIRAARDVKGAAYEQWQGDWPPAPGPPFYITGSTDDAYILREGINCAGVLNVALRKCGLPPAGGTGSIGDYLIELEDFDVNTPAVPGAIALRPWGGGVANLEEGHVAIYTGDGEHSLIQADHRGVNELDSDYDSQPWAQFTVYGLLPGVDYSGTEEKPNSSAILTPELLVKAMTSTAWSGPNLDPTDATRYFPHLVQACRANTINTRARLSAFLAQVGTESGSFKWWREFSRGKNDDGTDKPFGKWYGRGPIQLTWEANYQNFQKWTGYKAHDNPEIVADDPQAGFHSAGWYWRNGNGDLNTLADLATWPAFYEITGRVWGQAGPFAERDARYDHAWNVLPENLTLPNGGEKPPEEDKDEAQPVYATDGWWEPTQRGSKDLRYHPPT